MSVLERDEQLAALRQATEEAEVKRLLAVPRGFSLAAHLGIGWPARPHPSRLRRRPVEDFTSVDRYGGRSLRCEDVRSDESV